MIYEVPRISQTVYSQGIAKTFGSMENRALSYANEPEDLSNEDHCGPCGQYALDKTKTKSEISKNKS
jgi:hypothetical protein